MRILIVRHGEPDYVHDTLTEKGRREVELLADRLESIPVRDYYVSPLGRAQDTAKATLDRVHRTAETLPWLAEFRARTVDLHTGKPRLPWDFPPRDWLGRDLLFDREHWTEDPLVRVGDTADVWRETCEGIDALLERYSYRREGGIYRCESNEEFTIVLFCHFAVGTAVLAHLINIPPVPLWQGFIGFPTAVTTVVTEERVKGECVFRCIGYGDVRHLLEAGEPVALAGVYPECYNGVDSTDPARWPAMPKTPPLR